MKSKSEMKNLHFIKNGTIQYTVITTGSNLDAAPGPIFILQNEVIKHEVNGYKTEISTECIRNWNMEAPNAAVSYDEFLKEIRSCLTGSDTKYSFDIQNPSAVSPELILLSTKSSQRKLGVIELSPVSTSEALAALTNSCLQAAEEGSNKTVDSDIKFLELSKAMRQLESAYKALIVQKNVMEDQLYRAFAKCLNAKKDQIQRLKSGSSNLRGIEQISSTSKNATVETSCYDEDTDIEDLEDGSRSERLNVKMPPSRSRPNNSNPPRKEQSVTTTAEIIVDTDTDDDLTDFEGDFEPISRPVHAGPPVSADQQKKVQNIDKDSTSGSETDFEEPNSPSILNEAVEIESVPPKRRKVLTFDSEDSD